MGKLKRVFGSEKGKAKVLQLVAIFVAVLVNVGIVLFILHLLDGLKKTDIHGKFDIYGEAAMAVLEALPSDTDSETLGNTLNMVLDAQDKFTAGETWNLNKYGRTYTLTVGRTGAKQVIVVDTEGKEKEGKEDGEKYRLVVIKGKETIEVCTSGFGAEDKKFNTIEEGYCDGQGLEDLKPNKAQEFEFKGGVITSYRGSRVNIVIPNKILGEEVTALGKRSFYNRRIKSVVLPSRLTKIGEQAFDSNDITEVTIPGSVVDVGMYAFRDNSLTHVELSEGIGVLGYYAFKENNIEKLVIPNSLFAIGNGAFEDNPLSSVVVPESVMTIGKGAFKSNQEDAELLTIHSTGGSEAERYAVGNGHSFN